MAFKMKGITPLKQKKKTAIEAIKEVNTQNLSKSEKEIYLAKIRGDYQDLTGDKLKKASYDDPTGTVVSKGPEGPMASGNYDPSEPAFKMKGHELPGIKQRKSPYKNYKNPQDYKVFNYGNKPTPVKNKKKY